MCGWDQNESLPHDHHLLSLGKPFAVCYMYIYVKSSCKVRQYHYNLYNATSLHFAALYGYLLIIWLTYTAYKMYSKTATLKKTTYLVFKTNNRVLQVKNIAECSKESILQLFRLSLSYHFSLRSCSVFLSDRFTHVY